MSSCICCDFVPQRKTLHFQTLKLIHEGLRPCCHDVMWARKRFRVKVGMSQVHRRQLWTSFLFFRFSSELFFCENADFWNLFMSWFGCCWKKFCWQHLLWCVTMATGKSLALQSRLMPGIRHHIEMSWRRPGCRAGTKWRKRRKFKPFLSLIIRGNVRSLEAAAGLSGRWFYCHQDVASGTTWTPLYSDLRL